MKEENRIYVAKVGKDKTPEDYFDRMVEALPNNNYSMSGSYQSGKKTIVDIVRAIPLDIVGNIIHEESQNNQFNVLIVKVNDPKNHKELIGALDELRIE